jgi:hypothetical protein|tara:strand:- start:267 stop:707 length:441 start_codon:yes stop_codon:yes gene_type:complete
MDLSKEGFEMLDTTSSFEPLPDGWYAATVEKIEEKVSNAGNTYLNFVLSVAEGDHAGRKIFDGFHLWHPSSQTVQISQRRLSALFKAAGFSALGNTDDLLFEEVQVRVRVRAGSNGYDPSNEVRDYRSAGTAKPSVKSKAFGTQVA